MKKLLRILLTLSVLLTGCASNSSVPTPGQVQNNPLDKEWTTILSEAKGTTVNFYMWGGDERTNTWVDAVVASSMLKEYGVKVNRVPMGPDEYLNKLIGEKQANKQEGSIDLVWINGENFRTARQANLLWGPFADKVPNYQNYVDKTAPDIANDFGFPVEGYEVPYGKAQFVFASDTTKVKNPPKSSAELLEWLKKHPGRFTYPELPDFTGSVFVRQLMYELCGGYQAFPYTEQVNKATLNKQLQPLWDYLGAAKGYLWRQGKTYPSSIAALHQLFADGEVDITMSYNPAIFSGMIEQGLLPNSVRTNLWNNGTIGNTHFLAIPFNAANKNGALALADFMLSPEAQLSKYEPKNWGDLISLDVNKLDPQSLKDLEGINPGIATLSTEELQTHRLPEISAAYIPVIEELWKEQVIQSGQ
ncbi:ABC transporter substrate-binding protein [Desulfosporosinus shakirovi]|uniref:ABC transporter substrate-binding protein n=1 Tax=Desulfosporosinus shakirovi TaxID=2885154 RepID=UPI001E4BC142|nr:ABC transporter substrate-binding protein [Desulfosporosinus sp. SRJS8]MCB8814822.1 ABC transporter substrate-binding protein [Desulfosporosinus sp. SRJS8]